jgi:hypothetical protein
MPFLRSLAILLVGASVCWADHEVRTLTNQTYTGKVVAIKDQEVQIQEASGEIKKTPLSQVLFINLHPAKEPSVETPYTLVRLADDSQLYCSAAEFKGTDLLITLLSGQKAKLPLSSLAGVLRNAQEKEVRTQFDAALTKKLKTDQLMTFKEGKLRSLEGNLGDVDAEGARIQFRLDTGEVFNPKLANVRGLAWYRPRGAGKAPVCIVVDALGNTLAASDISLQGGTVAVTTSTGARIDFTESALSKLDFNRGKLTFLSDLLPSDIVETTPLLQVTQIVHYHKDTDLDGQPIVLGKVKHAKGLSMRSHTELEFELNGKYKEFKAILGADTTYSKIKTRAIVTIRCDGSQVFRERVNTDTPLPVDLNVANVQKLRIIVSSDIVGRESDRATLADARVSQ